MKILPISKIWPEDEPDFGSRIVSLAALHHLGVPVANGIVVTPPVELIQPILKCYLPEHEATLDQGLSLVSREIKSLPKPEEIEQAAVWSQLCDMWLDQLYKTVKKRGLLPVEQLLQQLTAQEILFVESIKAKGMLKYDLLLKNFQIELSDNELYQHFEGDLTQYANKIHKNILIPQNYEFIIETIQADKYAKDYLKFVNVTPLSTPENEIAPEMISQIQTEPEIANVVGTATKVYVNIPLSQLLVGTDRINPAEIAHNNISVLVLPLERQANQYVHFIYPFTYSSDPQQIAYFLNFKAEASPFSEIKLSIGGCTSADDYLSWQKMLLESKIKRDQQTHFWLRICLPENILNIDDYLVAGIDGVVIDGNELFSAIFGRSHSHNGLTKSQFQAITTLLKPLFKALHRSRVPVVVTGQIVEDANVLSFLLTQGVWGLVTTVENLDEFSQKLSQLEHHHAQRAFQVA